MNEKTKKITATSNTATKETTPAETTVASAPVKETGKHTKEKKVKRLCKWKKGRYAEKFEELEKIITPVRFICQKCGRAASEEKYLCKPIKIGQ